MVTSNSLWHFVHHLMIKQFYGISLYIYINHCKNSKLKLMDHSIENRRRGWFGSTIKTCIQKPNAMLMHRDVPCTPYILLVLRCQNAFCLICSKCTNSHLGISQSLNVLLYIYIIITDLVNSITISSCYSACHVYFNGFEHATHILLFSLSRILRLTTNYPSHIRLIRRRYEIKLALAQ